MGLCCTLGWDVEECAIEDTSVESAHLPIYFNGGGIAN